MLLNTKNYKIFFAFFFLLCVFYSLYYNIKSLIYFAIQFNHIFYIIGDFLYIKKKRMIN